MSEIMNAKMAEVAVIKEKIQKAKSVVLVDYKGLNVEQDTSLRVNLRKVNVEYKVLKNTMVRRAFNEIGLKEFDNDLNGATAVAFCYEDEVSAAKVIAAAGKDLKGKLAIKSGCVNGSYTDSAGMMVLASLPSKEQLYSKLMATLNEAARSLAAVLNAHATKESPEA